MDRQETRSAGSSPSDRHAAAAFSESSAGGIMPARWQASRPQAAQRDRTGSPVLDPSRVRTICCFTFLRSGGDPSKSRTPGFFAGGGGGGGIGGGSGGSTGLPSSQRPSAH